MSHRLDRVQPVIALTPLVEQAAEIFDVLPRSHSRTERGHPFSRRVLPAVLAKARDDLEALAELTASGRTSASAALGRVFLEATITFFYLTSGAPQTQEHRAAKFFLLALVSEKRQELVEHRMRQQGVCAGGGAGESLTSEALAAVTRQLEATEGPGAAMLRKVLRPDGQKVKPPGFPTVEGRLDAIKAPDQVVKNLRGGYERFYGHYSGFIHTTAALQYITQVDGSSDESGLALRKGPLPVGHSTPLECALLYAPDLLGRYNDRFLCGREEAINKLAKERWSAILS